VLLKGNNLRFSESIDINKLYSRFTEDDEHVEVGFSESIDSAKPIFVNGGEQFCKSLGEGATGSGFDVGEFGTGQLFSGHAAYKLGNVNLSKKNLAQESCHGDSENSDHKKTGKFALVKDKNCKLKESAKTGSFVIDDQHFSESTSKVFCNLEGGSGDRLMVMNFEDLPPPKANSRQRKFSSIKKRFNEKFGDEGFGRRRPHEYTEKLFGEPLKEISSDIKPGHVGPYTKNCINNFSFGALRINSSNLMVNKEKQANSSNKSKGKENCGLLGANGDDQRMKMKKNIEVIKRKSPKENFSSQEQSKDSQRASNKHMQYELDNTTPDGKHPARHEEDCDSLDPRCFDLKKNQNIKNSADFKQFISSTNIHKGKTSSENNLRDHHRPFAGHKKLPSPVSLDSNKKNSKSPKPHRKKKCVNKTLFQESSKNDSHSPNSTDKKRMHNSGASQSSSPKRPRGIFHNKAITESNVSNSINVFIPDSKNSLTKKSSNNCGVSDMSTINTTYGQNCNKENIGNYNFYSKENQNHAGEKLERHNINLSGNNFK
jgi:hypothetical protein